ncbi:MAG: hypothetical protein ACKV2T_11305 [Kofleriaceae bacterium]
MRRLALAALFASACGTFEEPSIVLDLRVLAMRTDIGDSNPSKADQVLEVDLATEPEISDLLEQLETTSVTAWIADPGKERRIVWSMTLCLIDDEGRCDRSLPHLEFGAGEIDDPDTSTSFQRPYAELLPGDSQTGTTMVAMLLRQIQRNPVAALGGVDLVIQMQLGGADEPRANDIFASKKLRISPRIPIERAPNANPSITGIETAVNGFSPVDNFASPGGQSVRCSDAAYQATPINARPNVSPGDAVTLFPNEANDTREDYAVPGLDGSTIILEETVSYQWLATYGGWSDETTGGGRDILGNQSLLGSDWTAPDLGGRDHLDVSIWMIQRDERFGVTPLETCITVVP